MFSKNLLNYNLEGYKKFYSDIGRTFYAILTNPNYYKTKNDRITNEEGNVSSNLKRIFWTELEIKLVNLESRFAILEADFGFRNAWKFTFVGTFVLVIFLIVTLYYYIY